MPFAWTKQRNRAAEMVAEDARTNEEIAAACGLSLAGLKKWKARPEFQARVAAILEDNRQKLRAQGLANKRNRIEALNEQHAYLEQVRAERAADTTMANVPGGKTGLIVRRFHTITKSDGSTQSIPEYTVDVGMLKEKRETMKQAAQELGEWSEKREVTGSMVIREYVGVDVDEV